MKKKLISILLATVMVFSCVACSKSSGSSTSDDSKTSTSASSDNTLVVSLGSAAKQLQPGCKPGRFYNSVSTVRVQRTCDYEQQ